MFAFWCRAGWRSLARFVAPSSTQRLLSVGRVVRRTAEPGHSRPKTTEKVPSPYVDDKFLFARRGDSLRLHFSLSSLQRVAHCVDTHDSCRRRR